MGFFKKVNGYIKLFGVDFDKMFSTINGIKEYRSDLKKLKNQKGTDSQFPIGKMKPIFGEKTVDSGIASGQYFFQDLIVAQRIFENKPFRHVDIGSRVDGFVAHVSIFREIEVFDIREQKSNVKNMIFKQADLMQLPENMYNYCDSISALHSIEHFGLGRYGDPIDYFGHEKALNNITKILKSGGVFYFSVPIGPQRINFNAHRVFSVGYLLKIFEKDYSLKSLSFVDDSGNLTEDVTLTPDNVSSNFGCTYGCGIFELIKK